MIGTFEAKLFLRELTALPVKFEAWSNSPLACGLANRAISRVFNQFPAMFTLSFLNLPLLRGSQDSSMKLLLNRDRKRTLPKRKRWSKRILRACLET